MLQTTVYCYLKLNHYLKNVRFKSLHSGPVGFNENYLLALMKTPTKKIFFQFISSRILENPETIYNLI